MDWKTCVWQIVFVKFQETIKMTETTHEALLRQTAATEEMLGYFQGQRAGFQANVAEAEGDYAQLAANLAGVVTEQMTTRITYDSANPSNLLKNGTFQTWSDLNSFVSALPGGASIEVLLPADSVLETSSTIRTNTSGAIGAKHILFRSTGAGDRPILRMGAHVNATQTVWHQPFDPSETLSSITILNVDLEWGPNPIEGNTFGNAQDFFRGARLSLYVRDSVVRGPVGVPFARPGLGSEMQVLLRSVTFDGVTALGRYSTQNMIRAALNSVTLQNGAVLYDPSFTIGSDLFLDQ
jgi:hypothetical protein